MTGIKTTFSFLFLLSVSASHCTNDSGDSLVSEAESRLDSDNDEETDNTNAVDTTEVTDLIEKALSEQKENQKFLRIIASSGEDVVGDLNLTVGASVELRAALFSPDGDYLEDADSVWSIQNTDFPSSDLSPANVTTTITFTPSSVGSTFITASYAGTDSGVLAGTDLTGTITVSSDAVPSTIAVYDGDNQTATAGSLLSVNPSVLVKDRFGDPVAGISVTFSAISGGGSIIDGQPATTNAVGVAESSVRLGSSSGVQSFRAAVDVDSNLTVDFNSTAVAGGASILVFTTDPDVAFSNAPFGTQPVVSVRDANGNVVTGATGSVVVSVGTGTGAISGTTSVSLSDGVASFSGLEYDTGEAGVILTATYGSITGNSSAFTVAAAPPGACQTNDAYFTTAGGGCQDVRTGVIWSNDSSSMKSWDATVWDESEAFNNASQDADDYGRTSDVDRVYGYSHGPDGSVENYCHDLVEGGQSDWRVPSLSETTELNNSLTIAGSTAYIQDHVNYFWIGSAWSNGNAAARRYNASTQASFSGTSTSTTSAYSRCIRGNRDGTLSFEVTTPDYIEQGGTDMLVRTPLTVQVKDSQGNDVNAEGLNITLATSLGTIAGTVTVATDYTGFATFDAFTLDTTGDATITITATGVTDKDIVLPVKQYLNSCLVSGDFETDAGGCKSIATGLIWSYISPSTMKWVDAIWEYRAGSFNLGDPPDADDGAATDDYDPGNSHGYSDTSTANYCHALTEGGYTDWRVPTEAEISSAFGIGNVLIYLHWMSTISDTGGGGYIWASTSSTATRAYRAQSRSASGYAVVSYSNGDISYYHHAVCVRN